MLVRKDIEARCDQIRKQIEETTSDYTGKNYRKGFQLAGGVAVIKVGGASEVEVKERRPCGRCNASTKLL